jgi:hypothetical protein
VVAVTEITEGLILAVTAAAQRRPRPGIESIAMAVLHLEGAPHEVRAIRPRNNRGGRFENFLRSTVGAGVCEGSARTPLGDGHHIFEPTRVQLNPGPLLRVEDLDQGFRAPSDVDTAIGIPMHLDLVGGIRLLHYRETSAPTVAAPPRRRHP